MAVGGSTGPGLAGPGGPGVPGGTVNGDDALAAIRGAIERMARSSYPLKARKLRMEGVVTVSFLINALGQPEEITVTSGSGFDLLDGAAVEIVRRAGPYPSISEPVRVPIRFSLRQQ
jgi:protein TonB